MTIELQTEDLEHKICRTPRNNEVNSLQKNIKKEISEINLD